jgi:hypothetical protein
MQPLISAILHTPMIPSAPKPETLPPAEDTVIEAVTLIPPLERELPDQAPHEVAQPPRDSIQPAEASAPTPGPASQPVQDTSSSRPEAVSALSQQAASLHVQAGESATRTDSPIAEPDSVSPIPSEAVNIVNEAKKNHQAFRF